MNCNRSRNGVNGYFLPDCDQILAGYFSDSIKASRRRFELRLLHRDH